MLGKLDKSEEAGQEGSKFKLRFVENATPSKNDFNFSPFVLGAMDDTKANVKKSGKELGDTIASETNKGIKDGKKDINGAVKEVTDNTSNNEVKENAKTNGKTIGKAISDGMALGIKEGKSGVITAAIEVSNAATVAANKKLGINSPSRVFKKLGIAIPE